MIAVLLAAQEAQSLLDRHQFGDWGKLPPEEVQENIISVQQGLKVISAYSLKTGTTIFVVTEADRSTTTLLLSEEV